MENLFEEKHFADQEPKCILISVVFPFRKKFRSTRSNATNLMDFLSFIIGALNNSFKDAFKGWKNVWKIKKLKIMPWGVWLLNYPRWTWFSKFKLSNESAEIHEFLEWIWIIIFKYVRSIDSLNQAEYENFSFLLLDAKIWKWFRKVRINNWLFILCCLPSLTHVIRFISSSMFLKCLNWRTAKERKHL